MVAHCWIMFCAVSVCGQVTRENVMGVDPEIGVVRDRVQRESRVSRDSDDDG